MKRGRNFNFISEIIAYQSHKPKQLFLKALGEQLCASLNIYLVVISIKVSREGTIPDISRLIRAVEQTPRLLNVQGTNPSHETISSDDFRGFPYSLHVNCGLKCNAIPVTGRGRP
jgi:hypothetical protein